MADYGIKIAKEGYDVNTAADKDLVYSSKFNGMKIAEHNTSGAGTVLHSLGYAPMFLNYRKSGTQYRLDWQTTSFVNAPYTTNAGIVFPNADNYYFIFIDKAE